MLRILKMIFSGFITTITSMSTVYAIASPIVEAELGKSPYLVIKNDLLLTRLLILVCAVHLVCTIWFRSRHKYPSFVLKDTDADGGYGRYYFEKDPRLTRDSIVEIYKRSRRYGDIPFALASVDKESEFNRNVMILRHFAYYDLDSKTYQRTRPFSDIPKNEVKQYRYHHSICTNPVLDANQGVKNNASA